MLMRKDSFIERMAKRTLKTEDELSLSPVSNLIQVVNAPFAIHSVGNIVFTHWPFLPFLIWELSVHKQGIKSCHL